MGNLEIKQLQKIIELQLPVVERLRKELKESREEVEKEVSEKYKESYGDDTSLFESYRRGYFVTAESAHKLSELEKDYNANMKFLVDAKTLLIDKVEKQKLETEEEIQRVRTNIDLLNLRVVIRRDENENITNLDEINATLATIRQEKSRLTELEGLLGELNTTLSSIVLTDEELSFRNRQLTDEELKKYNDLNDKMVSEVKDDKDEEKEYSYDEILEEYEKYQQKVLEYNDLLGRFVEEYDAFVELEKKLDNGEIKYDENYENTALNLIKMYNSTKSYYAELLEAKKQLLVKIGNKDLQGYAKKLNKDFEAEFHHRAQMENGLEEHNEPDILDRVNKVRGLIKTIGEDIQEPIEPAILGGKKTDPKPKIEVTDEFAEILEEYEKYKKKLSEYNDLLGRYYEEYDAFVELEKKLDNGEIEYDENYEEAALNIIKLYNLIKTYYEEILELKQKLLNKIGSREKLEEYFAKLSKDFEAEAYYRAHMENGLEQHTDFDIFDRYFKVSELRKALDEEVQEPIEPAILGETKETIVQEPEEKYELTELLWKIAGEEDEAYKWYDNFVYNTGNAKIWNWHKTKERTFADKPFKLVRTAIGSVITAGSKLVAGIIKKTTKADERIADCKKRIDSLTPGEIEFLKKYLTATKMKEYKGFPKVVISMLLDKFEEYERKKLESSNEKLFGLYNKLIDDFKACDEIVKKLKGNLSDEEREKLEQEKKRYDKILLDEIEEIIHIYGVADSEINKHGVPGMRDNLKFRMATLVGGRNSSTKGAPLQTGIAGRIARLRRISRETGDGYEAAKMFLYEEKVKKENTVTKRTLKNRFGKANVGAFSWEPFVDTADYTEYQYSKDVLMTIVTVSSILSIVNQIKQAKVIEQLQQQNAQLVSGYNALAGNYNNLVNDYNALVAWAKHVESETTNLMLNLSKGGDELAKHLEVTIRSFPGGLHGVSEYGAMHAGVADRIQSGLTNDATLMARGTVYTNIDNTLHPDTANLTHYGEQVILSSANKPTADRINDLLNCLNKMTNEAKKYANLIGPGNQAYMAINPGYDYTALTSLLQNVNNMNPGALTNVVTAVKNSADTLVQVVKGMPIKIVQAAHTISVTPISNTATLIPAIVTLAGCGVLGTYVPEVNKILSDTRSLKSALGAKLDEVDIDIHEEAKANFERAQKLKEEQGFYVRNGQRIFKKQPTLAEFEKDALEEKLRGRGL